MPNFLPDVENPNKARPAFQPNTCRLLRDLEFSKIQNKRSIVKVVPEHLRQKAYIKSLLRKCRSKKPHNNFVKDVYKRYFNNTKKIPEKVVAVLEQIAKE